MDCWSLWLNVASMETMHPNTKTVLLGIQPDDQHEPSQRRAS